VLTDTGHALLTEALPLWEQAQAASAQPLVEVDDAGLSQTPA
jgi:hypothetical protein